MVRLGGAWKLTSHGAAFSSDIATLAIKVSLGLCRPRTRLDLLLISRTMLTRSAACGWRGRRSTWMSRSWATSRRRLAVCLACPRPAARGRHRGTAPNRHYHPADGHHVRAHRARRLHPSTRPRDCRGRLAEAAFPQQLICVAFAHPDRSPGEHSQARQVASTRCEGEDPRPATRAAGPFEQLGRFARAATTTSVTGRPSPSPEALSSDSFRVQ